MQNVKSIFDAFTIDTIIQIAFGVKVDSLNDPTNPIIVNGRKIFQQDISALDLIKFTLIFFAPKLAELFKLEINESTTDFFTNLSLGIIDQKREEIAKQKSFAKANSFIEFMLEAEAENKKMNEEEGNNSLDENGNQAKKPTKCKRLSETFLQNFCSF